MLPVVALLALSCHGTIDPVPSRGPVLPVAKPWRKASPGARAIAPGVEFFQELIPATDTNGPVAFSYLRIDPKSNGIRIEAALAQDKVWGSDATHGRETVSRLARRRGALAAINGGYFGSGGDPVGLHVGQGELRSEPILGRTALVLDQNGNADIAPFNLKATLRSDNREWTVNGFNRPPSNTRQLLCYTARFDNASHRSPGRFECIVDTKGALPRHGTIEGRVVQTSDGGGAAIPEDGLVLSAGGALAEELRANLRKGSVVQLEIDLIPTGLCRIDPSEIRQAIAGAPRIVSNGQRDIRVAAESVKPDVAVGRNPRTAVGICRDGSLIFMVVDGRRESLSQGVTLDELADLLIKLGAVDAVNLDGGGSSTMVVEGAVVNAPSGEAERPIGDALLIFADRVADGPVQEVALSIPTRTIKVGDQLSLALPAGFDPEATVWGCNAGPGFVDQTGNFRALRGGKAVVQAKDRGRVAKGVIEVVGDAPVPTLATTPASRLAKDSSPAPRRQRRNSATATNVKSAEASRPLR